MRISEVPDRPGVYFFVGAAGEILYIGKATRLRRRLLSYLRSAAGSRMAMMLRRAQEIRILETGTERVALLLEAALVRHHQPPFNVRLRGGPAYPRLEVRMAGLAPHVRLAFDVEGDTEHVFGPFPDLRGLRPALAAVRRVYLSDPSALSDPANREAASRTFAGDLLTLLRTRSGPLLHRLSDARRNAEHDLRFERAGELYRASHVFERLAERTAISGSAAGVPLTRQPSGADSCRPRPGTRSPGDSTR